MPKPVAGEPKPYPIAVEQLALDDLRVRLANTRWPEKEPVDDWLQGIPLAYLQDICNYWKDSYDWRRCEAKINAFGSYRIDIDGLDFHFLHCRSSHSQARPLILTHGWPGSIVEFFELIPMLTEPENYGGTPNDAFHVVVPSLPGYGFSGKPTTTGWKIARIADAWSVLMKQLGYEKYYAQGGDWGSFVTTELGRRHAKCCEAVHINMIFAMPEGAVLESPTAAEVQAMTAGAHYQEQGSGYAKQQSTRPQTLGYALTDSPAGQAAWILEKFYEWTDNEGTPDSIATRDRLLDNIMLYWLTASATSSARLYWESFAAPDITQVATPVGCTVFPKEIFTPSRRWAQARFKNIIHWGEAQHGGHFAALEQPALLVNEIRECFRGFELQTGHFLETKKGL